jgi:hypothetical protein
MTEEWRPVRDFEGYVEVSSLGRVRSLDRVITLEKAGNRPALTYMHKGRLLKQARHPRGYMYISFSANGKLLPNAKVHHLVLEAFVGPRPDGAHGCHANDIPDDNRRENLRWDSNAANVADRVKLGKHRKTHCTRGHEYTPENSKPIPTAPYRRCRECARESSQRVKQNKKAKGSAE